MNIKTSILSTLQLVFLFVVVFKTYAQVPQGIPYQAAARGVNGQPLVNANVMVRFSIIDSVATGTTVYQETHAATTNTVGLFSVNVGLGTPVNGTFAGINWGKNFKFMKVELDPSGTGSNYTDLGTQQMMSVPYALYAGNVSGSSNPASTLASIHKIGISNSTTWVCPAGVYQVQVELWGGGGGGGHYWGGQPYTGQRGGDGGYNKQILNVVPGQAYVINIGAGGGAPCNICLNAGSGGDTYFDLLLLAQGGSGATQTSGQAQSGAVINYTYTNSGFIVGSRTYIPAGFVVNEPSISNGGQPGNNQGDGAGKAGEAGYCILTYQN